MPTGAVRCALQQFIDRDPSGMSGVHAFVKGLSELCLAAGEVTYVTLHEVEL